MVSFIRALFSNGLKTNSSFEKAILTGCMRISNESIFTGFNNLEINDINTILDREYLDSPLLYRLCQSLSRKPIGASWVHELKLVNKEIRSIFPKYINILFDYFVRKQNLSAFYQSIWDKNTDFIKEFIHNILSVMVSYYDTQEMFYHGMMVDILSNLYQYEIKPNREDGNGRTDIVLRDDHHRRAVIFEFKWCKTIDALSALPSAALQQVRNKHYAESIHKEGYKTVYAVGIGFCKKTCEIAIKDI